MKKFLSSVVVFITYVILFMAQTPLYEIGTNFATYINAKSLLESLLYFIKNGNFYIILIVIIAIFIYKLFIFLKNIFLKKIPLVTAMDYLRAYKVRLAPGCNNKLMIQEHILSQKYRNHPERKSNSIPRDLANLLSYAKDGEITIYGQKTKSIPHSRALNVKKAIKNEILFDAYNWSDDYSSIRDGQKLFYTNLKVPAIGLIKLVWKHKLPNYNLSAIGRIISIIYLVLCPLRG